jgi:iron complex transport system ATP-binding protein
MQLILSQLSIGYDECLCSDINIKLSAGKIHVLLGDNGLGKTTLFRTIAGVVKPLMGKVEVEAVSCEGVSFVSTEKPQIDFLSVKEYLSFGQNNVNDKELLRVLNSFSMQNFIEYDLSELSDGQFKKIAIVRQLLKKKAVLLLDEPSAFLDVKNKNFLIEMLQSLKPDQVVFLSTHDLDFAKKCGDLFYEISNKALIQVDKI